MNPCYHRARFLTSAAQLHQAPPDEGREVAFAGRSNAGKSSAINALCQQKNLARISRTPGRTRLLNFFLLDSERRLVDLPGYGYARVGAAVKQQWQGTLADYLETRRSLRGLILLMDIRHPLQEYDRQLVDWSRRMGLPAHLLLTKADKLSKGAARRALMQVRSEIPALGPALSVQAFSAVKREGIDEVHQVLDRWLGFPGGAEDALPATPEQSAG